LNLINENADTSKAIDNKNGNRTQRRANRSKPSEIVGLKHLTLLLYEKEMNCAGLTLVERSVWFF